MSVSKDFLIAVCVAFVAGFLYIQERQIHDLYMEFRQEVNSMKLAHKDEIHALELKFYEYYKKEDVQRALADIERNLDEQTNTMTNEILANTTRNILNQIGNIKSRLGEPVAFYCRISQHHYNVPPGTIIKFDDVKLNIGSGFSSSSGKFHAPEQGLYFFTWNYLIKTGTHAYIGAYVNGKQEVDSCTYGNQILHNLASGSLVVKLNTGDEVWLQVFYKQADFLHSTYTFFTGHKIIAMHEGS